MEVIVLGVVMVMDGGWNLKGMNQNATVSMQVRVDRYADEG